MEGGLGVGAGRVTRGGGPGRVVPAQRLAWVAVLVAGLAATACGTAGHQAATSTTTTGIPAVLAAQARPIGHGARFQPPVRGRILGPCRRPLGARQAVHVELFAANRVVLIPAGIGARPPLNVSEGRISGAHCYGALVTRDPTGVVLVRPGPTRRLSALFRSWGQPLSARRLTSFRAATGGRVAAYVGGRRWTGAPGNVPQAPHAEIVHELGPHVPPHTTYTFPPGG